jgi:hypothetical protein
MDEDEYNALPEEERQRIDQKRLQKKKDRILRYERIHLFFSQFSSLLFFIFREQRNKEEKARLEQERLLLKEAELQYEFDKFFLFIFCFNLEKNQKNLLQINLQLVKLQHCQVEVTKVLQQL